MLVAGLCLAAGCRRIESIARLPDTLTAVVQMRNGSYASVLVRLPPPGNLPAVELAPGIVAVGPRWMHVVTMRPAIGGDGRTTWSLELTDLGVDRTVTADVPSDARLVAIDAESLRLATDTEQLVLSASTGETMLAATDTPPLVERDAPGPLRGFRVRLAEQRLEMALPRTDPDHWDPLLQGVDSLVAVWWLNEARLPDWEQRAIEEQFSQVGVLAADIGTATVDGDLEEWRGGRALPVDDRRQVLSGESYWSGPLDASFGVGARIGGGRVFLAIRVRDDHPLPGRDRIDLRWPERTIEIGLAPDRQVTSGPGWEAAWTHLGRSEYGLEVAVDPGDLRPDRFALPLAIDFVDHDPGQGSTTLATAASPSNVGVGFHTEPDDATRE